MLASEAGRPRRLFPATDNTTALAAAEVQSKEQVLLQLFSATEFGEDVAQNEENR